jgi:FkbM family methyltransferase
LRDYGATLIDGSQIYLDLREPMCFSYFLHGCIPHERSEVKVLACLAREGDFFVDVGANVGFYTALARRWVGTSGMVLAFEPNPKCLALLAKSFGGDRKVTIVPSALGSAQGTGRLHVPFQGDRATLAAIQTARCSEVEVAVTSLDDYLQQHALPCPSLVKIDCEGMEFPVLQGMVNVLRAERPPIIAFEYIAEDALRFGATLDVITEYIHTTSRGVYQFFRFDPGARLRADRLQEATAQNDLIAVPAWRRSALADLVSA